MALAALSAFASQRSSGLVRSWGWEGPALSPVLPVSQPQQVDNAQIEAVADRSAAMHRSTLWAELCTVEHEAAVARQMGQALAAARAGALPPLRDRWGVKVCTTALGLPQLSTVEVLRSAKPRRQATLSIVTQLSLERLPMLESQVGEGFAFIWFCKWAGALSLHFLLLHSCH